MDEGSSRNRSRVIAVYLRRLCLTEGTTKVSFPPLLHITTVILAFPLPKVVVGNNRTVKYRPVYHKCSRFVCCRPGSNDAYSRLLAVCHLINAAASEDQQKSLLLFPNCWESEALVTTPPTLLYHL